MNRIAAHGTGTPLQALDAVHGGIIAATVARAVNGLDGACNAIGGMGCPVVAIGGCPMPYAKDVAPVALLLTPWVYALDIATGRAWTKEKPPV